MDFGMPLLDNLLTSGGISFQQRIDEIHAIGDFNVSAYQSTNGNGGAFLDTNCTSLATENLAEIFGFKTWGNNPPATTKNLQRVTGTPQTPSTSIEWYKDFCTTNVVPQLIIRSASDKYVRFFNGKTSDSYYETNPGSVTSMTHPIDIVEFIQFNFGTEANEVLNDLRWDGNVIQWGANGIVGGNLNGSVPFNLGDQMIRLKIDAGGNAEMWLNGTSIATGSRTYLSTEDRLGTSSHVCTHNFRMRIKKFGTFTDDELATLTNNSAILWPRTGTYPYPYKTNQWQATSSQWNGVAKQWEPGRSLTSVFQGGNGVEGTHSYYWVYWSSSDVTRFPIANKIDEHYKIPGTIHIDDVNTGDSVDSVSMDGVVITSGSVAFNTDAATTAIDLAANINGFQTRYLARESGNAVQILDTRMLFDTNTITFTTTGFTATKVDSPTGEFLNRNTYAVAGQLFNGIAGNGTTYVMRISKWRDSVGYEGDPFQTKWHRDNIV